MQTNYQVDREQIHLNGHRKQGEPPPGRAQNRYRLTHDPVFYITAGFFALLTTALPGLMGQPNFMPLLQALGLTIFAAIPLRNGELANALRVTALWLTIQLLAMISITWLVPIQASRAIPDGFTYGTALVTWVYTGDELPRSLLSAPLGRLLELAGVLLGSLLTGGLVGSWFLVRAVDLLGFAGGILTGQAPALLALLLGLAPWRLLTICGYAGFFLLLAQPILTNRWRPAFYLAHQRRLLVVSAALLVVGLGLEALLTGVWQTIFHP